MKDNKLDFQPENIIFLSKIDSYIKILNNHSDEEIKQMGIKK